MSLPSAQRAQYNDCLSKFLKIAPISAKTGRTTPFQAQLPSIILALISAKINICFDICGIYSLTGKFFGPGKHDEAQNFPKRSFFSIGTEAGRIFIWINRLLILTNIRKNIATDL